MYKIEKYKGFKRFNEQYGEIYRFLLENADEGCNEHFHWGRFEWMIGHSMLDVDNLDKIDMFKDENNQIVGLITYDTVYQDRVYILHSIDDEELLRNMVDYAANQEEGTVEIKVNSKDEALCRILREKKYVKGDICDNVLEINLSEDLTYDLPEGYDISPYDFKIDDWKYAVVIHRGFNHEGLPEKVEDDNEEEPAPNYNANLKVFVLDKDQYCAHCGVWYTKGKTAYIEPVVTIPECRKLGLGRAVIYEAISRAKKMGAERAVVLSSQEFYYSIGFKESSEFSDWIK